MKLKKVNIGTNRYVRKFKLANESIIYAVTIIDPEFVKDNNLSPAGKVYVIERSEAE